MNNETKTLIETIINALPSFTTDKTKVMFRDLLTRIYINGEIAGLAKAREIVNPKETINIGDEDHDLEVKLEDAERIVGYNEPF